MATIFTFPMRNDLPQYSFNITLSSQVFNIHIFFNVRMNRWIMDINDTSGNTILGGIPVLIDRNLTGQYVTLSVPLGVFICVDNTQQDQQPELFSFGIQNTLYYVDPTQ